MVVDNSGGGTARGLVLWFRCSRVRVWIRQRKRGGDVKTLDLRAAMETNSIGSCD